MTTLTPQRGRGAAPAERHIDPRIRDRRADVLRSEGRRRLRRALCVLAVAALAFGAWALLHSKVFSARVVTVVGAHRTSRDAVLAAAGLDHEPPLIDVDAGAAAARVERLPWVSTASVTREWPDGVRIAVVERTPVAAIAAAGGRWALADRTGRVLALDASPPAGLPEVSGPRPPGRPGSVAASDRAALVVAATLPRAFESQVREVRASGGGNVTLQLTSPLTVYLGSTSDLRQKYEDVAALLAGAAFSSGEVIDVSAPATPVVRHAAAAHGA